MGKRERVLLQERPSELQDKEQQQHTAHNTGLQALTQPMTTFIAQGHSFVKLLMRATETKARAATIKGWPPFTALRTAQGALLTSQGGGDREVCRSERVTP